MQRGSLMLKTFRFMKYFNSLSIKWMVVPIIGIFAACGDDSSSGSLDSMESDNSSSSVEISSVNEDVDFESSSSVENSVSSEDSAEYQDPFTFFTTPASTNLSLESDEDGFYDMGDVYEAVPKTSKIAFVIRHSKRYKSTEVESQLTPIGEQMAKDLGAKLTSDEKFHYASTNFVRTRKTAELIAEGRKEEAVVEIWDGINGAYFLKVSSDSLDALTNGRGGSPKYIARYSYGAFSSTNVVDQDVQPCFYEDFFARGNQFVNEVIVANMSKWERVSILVSHDVLVEPLIAFVSNRTINLKSFESPFHWVNYLSGIVVIVDEQNKITALPVKGDSVGWMIPSQEVKEE